MKHKFLNIFFLVILSTIFNVSHAQPSLSISQFFVSLNSTHPWRTTPLQLPHGELNSSLRLVLAGFLAFVAAAISSAGGVGGGGLYIPILTIVAGLELKAAASYSAFMVTGGSIANVGRQMFARRGGGDQPLIDYDIAVLMEPCMLLGVSIGVICNLVFPEWLITVVFAVFLAFCTFKTCRSGFSFWRSESAARAEAGESTEMPLLSSEMVGGEEEGRLEIPLMKLGMLLLIWVSFFLLYLLQGNSHGQGIINVEPCGTGYWIISSIQIPLAIIFTTWILLCRKSSRNTAATQQESSYASTSLWSTGELFFPVMALLAGVLGGVFGIGGGMLISPVFLQIGINPQVASATCSFIILFCSTMSATQYVLLGMEQVYGAIILAAVCFVASLIGLTVVQRAVTKYGRASLIVFSLGMVMALSTLLMTCFGAVQVWKDYASGKSMGFKTPC